LFFVFVPFVLSSHMFHESPYTLTDALLREVVEKMGEATNDYLEIPSENAISDDEAVNRVAKEYDVNRRFPSTDYDTLDTMIRDQEYLQHSSLWGHQYVAGGAGEGKQRLKPDGSLKNIQEVKTDSVLPAYCNPPNPCPKGYTREDGCLESFVNTAAFSREYQAAQECMCDTEHMFDCPTSTRDSEINALAQSIQNEGVMNHALDKIMEEFNVRGQHKNMVAKKHHMPEKQDEYMADLQRIAHEAASSAHHSDRNPYLEGEKLPIVAKKTPSYM